MNLIELFIQDIHDQRHIVDYAYVAPAAVMVYEYLITLSLEITLVWTANWSYTKVLFLLTRYIPLASMSFMVYEQIFLDVPLTTCSWSYFVATWLSTFSVMAAELILMTRTWAILNRDKRIAVACFIMWCGLFVVEGWSINALTQSIKMVEAPYPGFRGCFVTEISDIGYIGFYTLAGVDAVVLGLMSYSAFRAYQQGQSLKLANIVHRDGIMFYVYILGITVANATVVYFARESLKALLFALQVSAYSVLTSRVVINIRDVAQGSKDVGLHYLFEETLTTDFPIRFRAESEYDEPDVVLTLQEIPGPSREATAV